MDNSTTASCRLQKQIAAQNSYLASIKAGKRVVYKAPCVVDPVKQEKTTS